MKTLIYFLICLSAVVYYAVTAISSGLQDVSTPTKHFIMITYGIFSLGGLVSPLLFGRWSSTGWPNAFIKYFVNTFIAVLLGLIFMAAVMFAGDIVIIIKALFITVKTTLASTGHTEIVAVSRSPLNGQIAMLAGGLLTIGLLYGVTRRYRYLIRRIKIPIKDLPDAFDGLRIVHLSDIHSGSFDRPEAVSRGIEKALALQPDLVLFSGDLVNNRAEEFEPYLSIFARLKAPFGVFSVLGNHDYGDYVRWSSLHAKQENLQRLMELQRQAGWRLLLNEAVSLKKNGDVLTLIGVENWSGRASFSRYGNLAKALSGVPNDVPAILISHDPSHWDAEVAGIHPEIALTVSGHTHGMQFGIESRWFKWSPIQYVYKQWAGLYQHEHQYLYVNRGFGFLGYLGRLGMPPEIALLELKKNKTN